MEHQGTKTIETERLILRKFTADDLSAIFHNWTSDEKVTEFLRWPTHKALTSPNEFWKVGFWSTKNQTFTNGPLFQKKSVNLSVPFL